MSIHRLLCAWCLFCFWFSFLGVAWFDLVWFSLVCFRLWPFFIDTQHWLRQKYEWRICERCQCSRHIIQSKQLFRYVAKISKRDKTFALSQIGRTNEFIQTCHFSQFEPHYYWKQSHSDRRCAHFGVIFYKCQIPLRSDNALNGVCSHLTKQKKHTHISSVLFVFECVLLTFFLSSFLEIYFYLTLTVAHKVTVVFQAA